MKPSALLIISGIALLITGCTNLADKAVSGVYVTTSKNEYTILSDTLIIEAYNLTAGTYHIEKRSGYNLIRGGKVLPRQFSQKRWTATFDKEKQVLSESALGKQIYVNTSAGTVSSGATYEKIK
ncbi:hypothetical protein SNE25_04620 [Mucilaginibacter sabulilitoris]|uniref:Uncharacterized protein n=1 Tax=Mucilaginibacter sabulilitoris TaxID=1173583 RepID=A0ABZ0TSR5_9SPHI|nr:hypothetical protein [Mucilaginibacter sabulilitoris]WPU94804.1 hypothetical protein SNE25_04620 [Mucilaginibacter sabulilitoris]